MGGRAIPTVLAAIGISRLAGTGTGLRGSAVATLLLDVAVWPMTAAFALLTIAASGFGVFFGTAAFCALRHPGNFARAAGAGSFGIGFGKAFGATAGVAIRAVCFRAITGAGSVLGVNGAFGRATGVIFTDAEIGGTLATGLATTEGRRTGGAEEICDDSCFISANNAFNDCSARRAPEALYVLEGSAFACSRATISSDSACAMRASK